MMHDDADDDADNDDDADDADADNDDDDYGGEPKLTERNTAGNYEADNKDADGGELAGPPFASAPLN